MNEDRMGVKGQYEGMFKGGGAIATSFDPKPCVDSKMLAGKYRPLKSAAERRKALSIFRKHCNKS